MAGYLEYTKRETRKEMIMLKSNDGREREIWVNNSEWMRPKDIISEGSEMPDEVLELLRKWSSAVDEIRGDFQCKADIGYAYVD